MHQLYIRSIKRFCIIIFSIYILINSFLGLAYAAETQKLKIILDWYVNPNHAPLFVAQQQGYFKNNNLAVEFIAPSDPSDGPKLVAAGKADLAITYQPSYMLQRDQGLPLIWAGTLVDQPLDSLLVIDNGAVNSIKDLKNKTIGYSSSGISELMLKTVLEYNGLSLKDVNRVNVHYALTQALLSHKIEGFTGAMRNFEPIQMQLAGVPAKVFYPEENGFPDYDELIFVSNTSNKNNSAITLFLKSLEQGVAYLKAHPKQTWEVFANNHPELNNPFNQLAWQASVKFFADHPGKFNKEKYDNFALFLTQKGLIA